MIHPGCEGKTHFFRHAKSPILSLHTISYNTLSSTPHFNTQEPIHPDSAHHYSNIETPR